jgi:GTP 3',8-cyclase
MDLTLIETMPLGDIDGDRTDQYLPLSLVRAGSPSASRSRTSPTRPAGRRAMCGSKETGGRLGFITPLTHNFCESCNRVRLTCTGTLYMCLGQEDAADLRAPLRASKATSSLNAPSTRRSGASPRATTSSSTGAQAPRRLPPHERHRSTTRSPRTCRRR